MRAFMVWHDMRMACRGLAKQPFFSLMSVIVLALGIAGASTIFSIFNGLFLRPFPVPNQERLVDLNETAPKWNLQYAGIAYPDFHAWREHNRTFESMCAWMVRGANIFADGVAERVEGLAVTHDFFDVLGIHPMLGRCFTPEEDRPNGPSVILLSFGLWKRLCGKDPTILGRALELDGHPCTIIGVLPPEAAFPVAVDFWRPLAEDPDKNRDSWYLMGIGRIRKGVTVDQARDDLTRIHQGLAEEYASNEFTAPTVEPLRQRYLGSYRLGTSILLGGAGFVLLIACCNVTSMMLARGAHQGKEIVTRVALGATRWRIARQVLSESIVLAVVGGTAGVILGNRLLNALIGPLVDPLNVPAWLTFEPDVRYAFFFLFVIVSVTLFSGIVPAMHAAHVKGLYGVLQAAGARGTRSRTHWRTLNAIVVAQIALALVLMIGAGLTLRAMYRVQHVDPGFRAGGILTYQIILPYSEYADENKRRVFFEEHLERVRTSPGVVQAGLASLLPMSYHVGRSFDVEGGPERGPDEADPIILFQIATPGYFETMQIPLRSGRFFTREDNGAESERVVVINESFAKWFWPGQEVVGKRIRYRGSSDWMRVIGVAADVKHYGLEEPVRPGVYVPYGRAPSTDMFAVVRTAGEPFAALAAVRGIVKSMDPALPICSIKTMSQRVRDSMLLRDTYAWLFATCGAIATVMAFAGIYGVVGYSVSQRTQEVGIRVALGATTWDVLKMIMRQGGRLVFLGVGIGLLGALGLSHLLAPTLYQVSPLDPLTFIGVPLLLIAVAMAACCVPAQRAARTQPTVALRYE